MLGLAPVALAIALKDTHANNSALLNYLNFYKDMYWASTFSIYLAFGLIIWMQVQMIFLNAVHWLHSFYMFLAVVIIFVALLPEVTSLHKKPVGKGM